METRVPPDRGRGEEPGHPRARHRRLRRLLPVPRRHGRDGPALTGRDPAAYVGDSAVPDAVRTRTLGEETQRVFRARVVNPRWIAAMRRHGYKGAFEMAATVDYLFGYDATAGVVDDWMYEQLAVVLRVRRRRPASSCEQSNPWALRGIAERLLEAADRGLWAAPDAGDAGPAAGQAYLELEGDLEGGTEMTSYPFTAIVGMDDLRLALVLNAVSPAIGGVLVRGEKGTAKSTAVRALAAVLPTVDGRRRLPVLLRPARARPGVPGRTPRRRTVGDGASRPGSSSCRSARARTGVVGSLDIERALAEGVERLRAGAAGGRAPRRPLRRRGQPAPRPPRRPAARRRRAGRVLRGAGGRVGAARVALPAGRHDEPGGGRAAAAAARPVRADRRGRRAAATRGRGPRWCAAGSRSTPTRRPSPTGGAAPTTELAARIVAAPAPAAVGVDCRTRRCARSPRSARAFDVDGMRADLVTARAAIAHAAWDGPKRGQRRGRARGGPAGAAAPTAPQPVRRPRPGRGAARRGARRMPPSSPSPQPEPQPEPATARAAARTTDPDGPATTIPRAAAKAPPSSRPLTGSRRSPAPPTARRRPPTAPFRPRLIDDARVSARARPAAGPRAETDSGGSPRARRHAARRPVHLPATLAAAGAASACPRPRARRRSRAAPRRPARGACARAGRATSCCSSSTPAGRWRPGRGCARSRAPSCRCCSTPTSAATRSGWSRSAAPGPSSLLPPTSSVEAAAARLAGAAHRRPHPAGRGPAAGAAASCGVERLRDPRRRAAARRAHRRPGDRRPRRRPVGAGQRAAGLPAPGRPGSPPSSWTARRGPVRLGLAGGWPRPAGRGRCCGWTNSSAARRPSTLRPARPRQREGGLMPQGNPRRVPDDGLTTRQRRNRPLLIVHTGRDEGQVDGRLRAGPAGLDPGLVDRGVPVRQVARSGGSARRARSARWAGARARPARAAPVEWHKMGEGWSWIRAPAPTTTTPPTRREGWAEIQRDLAAQTLRLLRARRVHLPDEVGLGGRRRGRRDAAPAGRASSTWSSPAGTPTPGWSDAADLVIEMTKVKHPMDAGPEGPEGHRVVSVPRVVVAAPPPATARPPSPPG